jgi:hypothetical protein
LTGIEGSPWTPSEQRERSTAMKSKSTNSRSKSKAAFVVARASACTWVVAFSRRVIPGALFKSKEAALSYVTTLARAAGWSAPSVTILA